MKKYIPWLISLALSIWVISKMIPHRQASGLDIDGFSRLPVLVGGRVMPMDTLARMSLSVMNHHGTFTVEGRVEPASRWLLDVLMMPRRADAAKVFEVTNPDISPSGVEPCSSLARSLSGYKARRNATKSSFSCDVSFVPRIRLKNSTVSSSVSRRSSCR